MLRFFALILLLVMGIAPSWAAENWTAKAQNYLQNLQQATADFEIITPDGSARQGKFYLKRPGRLRFEYSAAPYDLIVADGTLINLYDATTKQAQSAPIQATLANFFLRKNMTLSGDLKVTKIDDKGAYVHLTMVQSKDPESGNLMLSFSKAPFVLKGWRVAEYNGNVTRVRLRNLVPNPKLPASLFVYKDASGKNQLNQ